MKLSPNIRVVAKVLNAEKANYTIEGHPGLGLLARGDGNGSWVVRYRVDGKQREHTLTNDAKNADFQEVVRVKNDWLTSSKVHRVDPKAVIEAKLLAASNDGVTFWDVFEAWISAPRANKSLRPRTVALYRWIFEKHMKPRFGSIPITTITKQDLKKHFESLRDKIIKSGGRDGKGGRGEIAGEAFTYSKAVFDYAVNQSYIPSNPMNGLMRPVPKEPERKATRPLRADELRAVWTGADLHLTPKFARMIKLALLLGRRRAEIAKAEIAELNLQKNAPLWIIRPREGNKSSSESLVPLPRLAAELLRAAVADAGASQFLFPQPHDAAKATSPDQLSHAWRRLCNHVAVPTDVELHGSRDLIVGALLSMGAPSLVVSHVLHHSSDMKSTVALRYYRTHEFRSEKFRALRLWQAQLSSVIGGRKIRTFKW